MNYHNLLHIDDDIDDCNFFEEALREVSDIYYQAITNPIIALDQLLDGTVKPDIIFLDINMPGMNGLDLLVALKHDREAAKIPVVIFSTSVLEEMKSRALEYGAQDYLVKPNSFEGLKKLLMSKLEIGQV